MAVESDKALATIYRLEKGEINSGIGTLEDIAKALGVEVGDLYPKDQGQLPLDYSSPVAGRSQVVGLQDYTNLVDLWRDYARGLVSYWERVLGEGLSELDAQPEPEAQPKPEAHPAPQPKRGSKGGIVGTVGPPTRARSVSEARLLVQVLTGQIEVLFEAVAVPQYSAESHGVQFMATEESQAYWYELWIDAFRSLHRIADQSQKEITEATKKADGPEDQGNVRYMALYRDKLAKLEKGIDQLEQDAEKRNLA